MSVKEHTQTELEKLSHMSFKDKLWYIWEYYKFHILIILLIIGMFGMIGNILYRQTFTTKLSMAVINDSSGGTADTEAFKTRIRQELGYGKKDILEINEGLFASFDEESMSQYAYASLAKISALVASHSLDVMITDQEAIDHFSSLSAFADLRDFLPEDLYEKAEPYLLYSVDESGQKVAAAVSLEGTSFMEETGIRMDPPYLGVISSTSHTEDVLNLLRVLFDLPVS